MMIRLRIADFDDKNRELMKKGVLQFIISRILGLAMSLLVNSCPNLRWHATISSLNLPPQLLVGSPFF